MRSVLGRFLEHSRLYWFKAGGAEHLFCSSADWMSRNLMRRVETCFPIEDAGIKARLVREVFDISFAPDVRAWNLTPFGNYERTTPPEGEALRDAQQVLLDDMATSEDFQFDSEGREELSPIFDVRTSKRMGGEPSRRKDKSKNRSRNKKRRGGKDKGSSVSVKTNGQPKKDR